MKVSSYQDFEKAEIQALYTRTFTDSENREEGELIAQLVLNIMNETDEDDIYGFVAAENEQPIGCIFFTRLSFDSSVVAFLLSPVAVHTSYQGKGIGQTLINYGLEQLKTNAVGLAFTYGDPNYYSQVGFQQISEELIQAPFNLSQPQGWLCQNLNGGAIEAQPGRSRCVKAFADPDIW